MPPSAATSSAPSSPCRCRSTSTISRATAGLAPEWKNLLRDLDRLQQVRIRHRGADWLVRTDAAPAVTALFNHAHIALPPRARQPVPRRQPPPKSRPKTPRPPEA